MARSNLFTVLTKALTARKPGTATRSGHHHRSHESGADGETWLSALRNSTTARDQIMQRRISFGSEDSDT